MMKHVMSLLMLFVVNAVAFAQPKAVLSGPNHKEVGRLVIIKTSGTTMGPDIKFDCAPKNEDWQAVNFQNGEPGIIFATDKPGTYHFFIAVSDKEGKIATAIHEVVIGTVTPKVDLKVDPKEPKLATLDEVIAKAFKADSAAKNGIIDHKNVLATIYRSAAKSVFNKDLVKVSQIYDSMRNSAEAFLPKTTLTNVRSVISQFQQENLKVEADTPLTDDLRNTLSQVFITIASSLEKAN